MEQRDRYSKIYARNQKSKQAFTPDQKQKYERLTTTQAKIYSEILESTNEPDYIAEVLAERKVIAMVEGG